MLGFLSHHAMAAINVIADAAGGLDAENMWGQVIDLLGTWILRLGGVVIVIGAIMFGLGFQRDDADGKSRGVMTIIAGAIVMAVCAIIPTLVG